MIELRLTTFQAKQLEQYIEEHMYFCASSLNGIDENIPEDWQPFDAYCGCSTCESREYLMATFTWLRLNGHVDVFVDDFNEEDMYENTLFD